jgi:NAD(P)-dependent dehydrogenase (short-subunit alcohol dehydrogenase family)
MNAENKSLAIPEIAADERLRGKVAVVTGGGSAGELAGSGAAISVLFAAKGAQVVIVDRDEERGRNTAGLIASRGGEAEVIPADITKAGDCETACAGAVDRFGRLDILVNNAAIAPAEQEPTNELWDEVFELNLKAAKLMSDAAIPRIVAGGGGAIVNIASLAGLVAGGGLAYTAAKTGLIGLTRALAYEHGREGVRVNAVAPGHVLTPMGIGFSGWSDDLNGARRLRASAGLLNTEGTGWDVAYAALFLAGEESRWITATTIPVDAGTSEVMPIVMHSRLVEVEKLDG